MSGLENYIISFVVVQLLMCICSRHVVVILLFKQLFARKHSLVVLGEQEIMFCCRGGFALLPFLEPYW